MSLRNGVVEDWDGMQAVLKHVFTDVLSLSDTAGCHIMLTEAPQNPLANRARMLQVRVRAGARGQAPGLRALPWRRTARGASHASPHAPPLPPPPSLICVPQTMFETFGFEGAYVQVQAVLTLYSQGLLTGLVLDSGDGVTHAVRRAWEGCRRCGEGLRGVQAVWRGGGARGAGAEEGAEGCAGGVGRA